MSLPQQDFSVDWIRIPLPKETLRSLNERSDLMGFLQSGFHLALYALTFAWCVHLWNGSSWLLFGVGLTLHGTVFKTPILNVIFGKIFGFIGWHSPDGFWASHQRHHLYTLYQPHDLEETLPKKNLLQAFLRTFFWPMDLWNTIKGRFVAATGGFNDGWMRSLLENQPEKKVVQQWAIALLVGHALIFCISWATGWWILSILISGTPAYGKSLQFVLNQTQHIGMRDEVNDFRLNCRTFDTNPLFKMLY